MRDPVDYDFSSFYAEDYDFDAKLREQAQAATTPAVTPTPVSGVIPNFVPQSLAPIKTEGPIQGPMIGNNLGKDAAAVINSGGSLSATQRAAGEAYIAAQKKPTSSTDQDAFALIKETFRLYDLEELFPVIEKLMTDDVGPEQAALMLKTDPRYNAAYVKRFAGNETRRAAGLNTLSEAEYLALEDSYTSTLKSFGLQSQFGLTREEKQKQMANIIGNDISATEFKDRVDTVVTRVQNADSSIKDTLTSFFGIKEADLVDYFLRPTEALPKLQEKVTAAEIGAAAKGQNLATSAEAATALAKFGVTKAQALEGYANIGEIMPTASFLGDIYGDKYDQATAEAEVFKGTASAKRKRQQLAEREVASFSGSSGRLRTGQQQGNTGQF